MAQLLPIPTNVPEEVSTGYQRQNTNFNAVTVGHINIGLGNINNSNAPSITEGSVIEVNGGIYRAASTESVTNASSADGLSPPAQNTKNYIYAVPVPNTSSLSWKYSGSAPTWSTSKGGWYSGNNRAVVKLFVSDTQYNGKIILDSYNAMRLINTEQAVPTTGGVQVVTGVVNEVRSTTLPAGTYRYEIQAGKGGAGGGSIEGAGGAGAAGEAKSGTFRLEVPRKIYYALGGDGGDGGDGEVRASGGGGSGGSAFLDLGDDFIFCLGGSGGGGAGGRYGAGGGAGGYGKGEDIISNNGSMGGNNGIGGNGGNTGGGGGSGILGGGVGGYNAYSGGGYGQPGGRGRNTGVAGGNSLTGEKAPGPTDKYTHQIQYQGGGSGEGESNSETTSGSGGSALKSTSSGYLRIYRMW
jgi:hypothetical protein